MDTKPSVSRSLRAGVFAFALLSGGAGAGATNAPVPAGWVEYAAVYPGGLIYTAKLDSGARISSIHATGIKLIEKAGKRWVSFRLKALDGKVRLFERPLVRISRTRDMTGPSISRPVVHLTLCVGNMVAVTEVNLSNRRKFNHDLLIGRNFMRGRFLLNPGERHLRKLTCGADPVL